MPGVADLRRDLAQLRRDAHQALGTAPARSDPTIVEDLQRQAAELRVQLMNERDAARSLQAAVAPNPEDLTARPPARAQPDQGRASAHPPGTGETTYQGVRGKRSDADVGN